MDKSSPVPSGPTYVVRFWCEWSGSGRRWRGRVEDVQTGEGIAFLELQELLDYIRGRGVMATGTSAPAAGENST